MGTDFWRHMLTFLDRALLAEKTIDATDRDLFDLTDSVDEALELVRSKAAAA